jgi:hypothetical protein
MTAPDGTTTSTLVSWVLTGCRVRLQGTIDLHGLAHRWSDTRGVCSKLVTIVLHNLVPRASTLCVVRVEVY